MAVWREGAIGPLVTARWTLTLLLDAAATSAGPGAQTRRATPPVPPPPQIGTRRDMGTHTIPVVQRRGRYDRFEENINRISSIGATVSEQMNA
jgi:hypothetical protein